jgi:hypothetical protein
MENGELVLPLFGDNRGRIKNRPLSFPVDQGRNHLKRVLSFSLKEPGKNGMFLSGFHIFPLVKIRPATAAILLPGFDLISAVFAIHSHSSG